MQLKPQLHWELSDQSQVFGELSIFIVAFLQNSTIEYSVESLCVSVFLCACACVFLDVDSKRN